MDGSILRQSLTRPMSAMSQYLILMRSSGCCFYPENLKTIPKYIQHMAHGDHSFVELPSQLFEEKGIDSSIPNAVTATCIVYFKQIDQQYPYAYDLQSLMSFFDRKAYRHHYIPQEKGQT
jgi:hypothetical protein